LDKVEYLRKNDDELSGYNKTSGKEAAWLTGGLGTAGLVVGAIMGGPLGALIGATIAGSLGAGIAND
jgi:hypothetical protein